MKDGAHPGGHRCLLSHKGIVFLNSRIAIAVGFSVLLLVQDRSHEPHSNPIQSPAVGELFNRAQCPSLQHRAFTSCSQEQQRSTLSPLSCFQGQENLTEVKKHLAEKNEQEVKPAQGWFSSCMQLWTITITPTCQSTHIIVPCRHSPQQTQGAFSFCGKNPSQLLSNPPDLPWWALSLLPNALPDNPNQ